MAGLSFVGALDILSEIQLEFVTNILQERGFTDGKVIVELLGKKGDNYVANVYRLTFEGNNGSIFKMIAKIAPKNSTVRMMMPIEMFFRNEHVMYTQVLPALTEQEEIAGVPKNDRFNYPICFGSLSEPPNEIILLEDLADSNFVMLDRMQSLSNESVKLSIEKLAKLHSLSYVMKYKKAETYNSLKQKLSNMWVVLADSSETKEFNSQMEKDVLDIVDDEKYKRVIHGSLSNIIDISIKLNKLDAESKSSVIHQADCWTNNIMFKLKDNVSIDCIMIDYQLSKEANPTVDILYLILNCTDYETRSKYFHEWIDFYHAALDDHLSYFGLKVSLVYPRDQLDADMRRHGRLGLASAIMLASVMVRESKDAIDFKTDTDVLQGNIENIGDKFKMNVLNKETLYRFKKKIEGLVDSVIEFGLI